MARGLLQLFLFQGSNPLLVKLDYEVTKVSGKFSKVHLQFSEEFKKVISDNKKVLKIDPLSEDDAVVEVKYLICLVMTIIETFAPGGVEKEYSLCHGECQHQSQPK